MQLESTTPRNNTLPPAAGLTVSKLNLSYDSAPCLTDISCEIRPGSITGLVGANSSGKTALAQVLAQWRPSDSGEIHLTDDTGTPLTTKNVSDHVWYSWHLGSFLPEVSLATQVPTVCEWMPAFSPAAFTKHLKACKISAKASPQDLSQGKRAALALTTALAVPHPILVLDESFTGMDAATKSYFIEQLIEESANSERTLILCDHDLAELERLVEEVIVLDHGRVRYVGPIDELLDSYLQVEGRSEDVDEFCRAHTVLSRKSLGVLDQAIIKVDDASQHQIPLNLNDKSLQTQRVTLADAVNALSTKSTS